MGIGTGEVVGGLAVGDVYDQHGTDLRAIAVKQRTAVYDLPENGLEVSEMPRCFRSSQGQTVRPLVADHSEKPDCFPSISWGIGSGARVLNIV